MKKSFKVSKPLFLPFYNEWCKNKYTTDKAFQYDPFIIDASSTSGSPVVLCENLFVGFLNENGGEFAFDGEETLTVTVPEGQELFVSGKGFSAAEEYNQRILGEYTSNKKEWFNQIEYCTWVEQKMFTPTGTLPERALNEKLVINILDRIDKMNLPQGKFTIDSSWYAASGKGSLGDFEIDRERFPDFEGIIKEIEARGHTPGLWIAPGLLDTECDYFQTDDQRGFGIWQVGECIDKSKKIVFANVDKLYSEHYRRIIEKYIGLGIKKFKVDILYSRKDKMKEILKAIYTIAKSIDPRVEIESHIPDIFASRYCDVIRINDLMVNQQHDWVSLCNAHYEVCKLGAPDKVLNLDHIGGNGVDVTKEDYLKHFDMLMKMDGYPVVSLLPDNFDSETVDRIRDGLNEWKKNKR